MVMPAVSVDFDSVMGKVKPMHAVNNGPSMPTTAQVRENFEAYKAAKIPYARNHDASFAAGYGGEHIVDVHAIFPDFNKNPYHPDSYDFTLTDDYTARIIEAGTEVFYRLGTKIEHERKKYGSIVPADFHKWAVICEHIIKHYNEGWADGFHYGIVYWEIWNEPDGKSGEDQPNWSGSPEEYYEFYEISATHLKSRFPHLKIGGPALSWFWGPNKEWAINFLKHLTRDGKKVPLDFFSWHSYPYDPNWIAELAADIRKYLDQYGYTETESILDEYNYLENWTDKFVSTIQAIIGIRGAAFTAACMAVGQTSDIDMLMYYDAGLAAVFNGMFDFYTLKPLKGYYPFVMFSKLYELGDSVKSVSDDKNIFLTAAKGETGYAVMLTHYRLEKEEEVDVPVEIFLNGAPDGIWRIQRLDNQHTMEESYVEVKNGVLFVNMQENSVILLSQMD